MLSSIVSSLLMQNKLFKTEYHYHDEITEKSGHSKETVTTCNSVHYEKRCTHMALA